MQESELALFLDRARNCISNNLHRFTYGGKFEKRHFGDVCTILWIKYLTGGFEARDRHDFYKKIRECSSSTETQKTCSVLEAATANDDDEQSYEQLIEALLGEDNSVTTKDCFLYVFDFLSKDFLVALPPEDLPSGSTADIPVLNVTTVFPVLLKTNRAEAHLGWFYRRVATIRARVRECIIADGVKFRIAEYLEDVTESHLHKFENGLLSNVLRSRTPFHERRLLQMCGIPCRQALDDITYERMATGLHPIPVQDGRTFQSRDTVVYEALKGLLGFEEEIRSVSSLEKLEDLLDEHENKNHRWLMLEKLTILRKIASFQDVLLRPELDKRRTSVSMNRRKAESHGRAA